MKRTASVFLMLATLGGCISADRGERGPSNPQAQVPPQAPSSWKQFDRSSPSYAYKNQSPRPKAGAPSAASPDAAGMAAQSHVAAKPSAPAASPASGVSRATAVAANDVS